VDIAQPAESFRGLLLRHRGRTGLFQRDFAARAGVSLRSVQEWEAGEKFPTADRLQAVIEVFLDADGCTRGQRSLPDVDGVTVTQAIRAECPDVRVIILTSVADGLEDLR